MVDKDKLVSLLQDRYEIGESLGKGGMGAVWKAYDKFLGLDVAIKIISTESFVLDVVSRFQREAKLSSKLKHKNIITIFDFGLLEDNLPYMVLEFFPGQTLEEFIELNGPLDINECLPIFTQLAEGLSHAHQKGVIHRDLKPANIILRTKNDNYEVKILDFGIAKPSNTEGVETLTKADSIIGSPLYMSPEQSKSEEIDTRSDIYSLGCLLYVILVGSPPIKGKNVVETIFLKVREAAPTLKESGIEASEMLETIVAKCLAIEPEHRYQSVEDLLDDLKSLEENLHGGETYEEDEDEILEEEKQRKPKFAIVGIVALLLVSFIVLAFFLPGVLSPVNKDSTEYSAKGPDRFSRVKTSAIGLKYEPKKDVWTITAGSSNRDYKDFKKSDKNEVRELQIRGVMPDQKILKQIKEMNPRQVVFSDVETVTTSTIKEMAQFSNLEELSFRYSNLESPEILEELSNFPKLSRLMFEGTKINNKGFTSKDIMSINDIESLEKLFFNRTLIDKDALRSLSTEHKFERLSLAKLPLDENDLSFIQNMKISNLAIHDMAISPEFFFKLTKLNLVSISLNSILIPVTPDVGSINSKPIEIPWKETSVIELSRRLPKTLIGSTYGNYVNGVYLDSKPEPNSVAIEKSPSKGPYAWTILHNATRRDFYTLAAKKNVRRLDIHERAFDSSTYDLLRKLPLESIAFYEIYAIDVPEVKSVCSIKTISTIKFDRCIFKSPEVFECFSKLPSLGRVEILDCRVRDHKLSSQDIAIISKQPSVKTFILKRVHLEPGALKGIPQSRHFREISLDGLKLQTKDFKFLMQMKVDNIGLRNNVVSYDFVRQLLQAKKLTSINLKQAKNEKKELWTRDDIKEMSREFKDTVFHSSYGDFRHGLKQQ